MEEVLNKILEKLDKIELDVFTVKSGQEKLDKIELEVSTIKSNLKQLDKKVDGIIEVVAKTMEDINGLKSTVEKQQVEIHVIKGGAANA